MAEILIESVTKRFGNFVAVNDVSLTVEDQEFVVLLGPSGCGKTTLLRAIAGLGMADEGRICIGGRDVTYLPPRERNLSMVFQSYAIFPHMKVYDNIAFGLKMNKFDKRETDGGCARHPSCCTSRRCSTASRRDERWPAAAGGGSAGDRYEVAGAVDGRAAQQPGCPAAAEDARRAQAPAAGDQDHHPVRNPRPDRGAQHGRPDRGDEGGVILQCDEPGTVYDKPTKPIRGRLYWHPADELHGGEGGAPRWACDGLHRRFPLDASRLHAAAAGLYAGRSINVGIRAENMQVLKEPAGMPAGGVS
jgi:multiple sugar transport system ATP-binding protein